MPQVSGCPTGKGSRAVAQGIHSPAAFFTFFPCTAASYSKGAAAIFARATVQGTDRPRECLKAKVAVATADSDGKTTVASKAKGVAKPLVTTECANVERPVRKTAAKTPPPSKKDFKDVFGILKKHSLLFPCPDIITDKTVPLNIALPVAMAKIPPFQKRVMCVPASCIIHGSIDTEAREVYAAKAFAQG